MVDALPQDGLPRVIGGFALLRARAAWRRLSQRAGVGRPRELGLEALAAPDSALAGRAIEVAEDCYNAHLLGHGWRTFALARAVALHLELRPDPEVLFVACLLHDVGFCEAHAGPQPFELLGARVARRTCGSDALRGEAAHDAVALHTSVRAAFGPAEIRLVQSGSGGDLVGLDREMVHWRTRRAIERRWPKAADFAPRLVGCLRRAVRPHPESPGAKLLQVGFGRQVLRRHALAAAPR